MPASKEASAPDAMGRQEGLSLAYAECFLFNITGFLLFNGLLAGNYDYSVLQRWSVNASFYFLCVSLGSHIVLATLPVEPPNVRMYVSLVNSGAADVYCRVSFTIFLTFLAALLDAQDVWYSTSVAGDDVRRSMAHLFVYGGRGAGKSTSVGMICAGASFAFILVAFLLSLYVATSGRVTGESHVGVFGSNHLLLTSLFVSAVGYSVARRQLPYCQDDIVGHATFAACLLVIEILHFVGLYFGEVLADMLPNGDDVAWWLHALKKLIAEAGEVVGVLFAIIHVVIQHAHIDNGTAHMTLLVSSLCITGSVLGITWSVAKEALLLNQRVGAREGGGDEPKQVVEEKKDREGASGNSQFIPGNKSMWKLSAPLHKRL